MTSICFVGIDNYPAIDTNYESEKIGGESIQQALLAFEFAKRGYRVSSVVKDYGQPQLNTIDGVTCFKSFKEGAGLPIVRFVYPRAYKLWQALVAANADIYYQSCASFLTGLTALFCKVYGRKFVFRVAHDTDCIPGEELIPNKRDKWIYQWGLKQADVVYSQSQQQSVLLEQNYGIPSVQIDMLVDTDVDRSGERDIDVLWVNNIRPIKRPDLLLSLSERMPNVRFVMAGGAEPGHVDYYEEIKAKSTRCPNVDFLGKVPFSEIGRYFSRAKLFVNTSDSEGFPNTFLQSWVRGVPVFSFFDPDDVITRHDLGDSPKNLDAMVLSIQSALDNDAYKQYGKNVTGYIDEHNAPSTVVDNYLKTFGL